MPDGADLICFHVGPRGGVTFDGFCSTPVERWVSEHNDTKVQISFTKKVIFGLNSIGLEQVWKASVKSLRENCPDQGIIAIDSGEFAKNYLLCEQGS